MFPVGVLLSSKHGALLVPSSQANIYIFELLNGHLSESHHLSFQCEVLQYFTPDSTHK